MEILERIEQFLLNYMDAQTAGIVALIVFVGAILGILLGVVKIFSRLVMIAAGLKPLGDDCSRLNSYRNCLGEFSIARYQLGDYAGLPGRRYCLYFSNLSKMSNITAFLIIGNAVFLLCLRSVYLTTNNRFGNTGSRGIGGGKPI